MPTTPVTVLPDHSIIPKIGKQIPIGKRINILETSMELFKNAVDKCDAADISNLATKIGVYSATLRQDLSGAKDDMSLKSLVDLDIIEKRFTNEHNRLKEGYCRCKIKKGLLHFL